MNISLIILFAVMIVASIILSIVALVRPKPVCQCPSAGSATQITVDGQTIEDYIKSLLPPTPTPTPSPFFWKAGLNNSESCDQYCAQESNTNAPASWCVGAYDKNAKKVFDCSTQPAAGSTVSCLCERTHDLEKVPDWK